MKTQQNSSPLEGATGVFRGATECGSGPTKESESLTRDGGNGRGLPLGLRNNNPLNIRRVAGEHWKGEQPPSNSPLKGEDREFVRFESIEWGIRTAFCILETYRRKYKAVCIEDIINRWAPPSENDTRKYIETVCRLTGFGGKERLAEDQLPALVHAMARQEIGVVLDEGLIQKGFALYREIKN